MASTIPVSARSHAVRNAAKLARTAVPGASLSTSPFPLALCLQFGPGCVSGSPHAASRRPFSTTPVARLRDFFPPKDTPHILRTKAAWPHHGYTMDEMTAVLPAHRPPRTLSDRVAWKIVRFARYCMDKATGMDRDQQVDKKNLTTAVKAEKPLTEAQWVSLRQS